MFCVMSTFAYVLEVHFDANTIVLLLKSFFNVGLVSRVFLHCGIAAFT